MPGHELAKQVIKKFEGLRLKAYQDQGGVWTIGYGAIGPGISAGVRWTEAQADARLDADLAALFPRIEALVKVPLTDGQFAALCSFAFNLGVFRLEKSTLLKKLNAHDYAGAADQFPLWCHVGSFKSPGLLWRRNEERRIFLGIDTAALHE